MKSLIVILALGCVISAVTAQIPCSQEVTYEVVTTCEWTSATHPTDYPSDGIDFSLMCGTVHDGHYRIWQVGGTATPAVKAISELGNCAPLEEEVTNCQSEGYCQEDSYFSWDCESPTDNPTVCTFAGNVTMLGSYSKISMLSMIAPSPDWNIGVDSLDLCQADETGAETWMEEYPVNGTIGLFAWDAGTDGGESYQSNNVPLSVFEPIRTYDAEDASNIFFNPELNDVLPICEVKVTLLTDEFEV